MAKATCSCQGGVKIMLACAGASNVGQMTNEVAKRLDEAGAARYFCLAGVGGHISGMIESVKGADKVLMLDGCEVACGRKAMEAAKIKGFDHLVVTNMGIKKAHDFKMPEDQLKAVQKTAADMLK